MSPKKKGAGGAGATLLCAFLVIGMVAGAGLLIVISEFTQPGYFNPTTTDTDTDTDTTTTDTLALKKFTFKARWDYVPIMQIDGPPSLDLEVYDPANDYFVDYVSMSEELTWYDAVNQHQFNEGEIMKVLVVDLAGWNFQIDGDAFVLIEVGSPMSQSWDLLSGDDDWGNLWFEWIEVL